MWPPVSRAPWCLGHQRRLIAATSREESANCHLKGGERRRPPLKKVPTGEAQAHNTTQQHNTTTTQPPTHHHNSTRRSAHHTAPPSLSLFLSCPSCFVSVLTRVCLCVLMHACSSVCLSLSVFLSVCHRDLERSRCVRAQVSASPKDGQLCFRRAKSEACYRCATDVPIVRDTCVLGRKTSRTKW